MKSGLSHEDAGKFIPKVTFTDSKVEKYLLSVRYEDWEEESKLIRSVKKSLKNISSTESSPSPKSKTQKYQEWINLEGKTIKAKYVNLEDGFVSLIMTSGSTVKYPLNKLSEDSQNLARSLSEAADVSN